MDTFFKTGTSKMIVLRKRMSVETMEAGFLLLRCLSRHSAWPCRERVKKHLLSEGDTVCRARHMDEGKAKETIALEKPRQTQRHLE